MSTEKVVLIASSSTRTLDRDVDQLSGLLEYIIKKAGDKLNADFTLDVISDVPALFERPAVADKCEHVFGIYNPTTELYIDFQYSSFVPDHATLRCARCGVEYSIFKSKEEIQKACIPKNGKKQNLPNASFSENVEPAR